VLAWIAVIGAIVWMSQYFEKQRAQARRNGTTAIIDRGDSQQNTRDAEALRECIYRK